MGLIKFGSRVDVIVPVAYRVLVKKGDRVKNGLTPIAGPGLGSGSHGIPASLSGGAGAARGGSGAGDAGGAGGAGGAGR
jgi:hypothetical protein